MNRPLLATTCSWALICGWITAAAAQSHNHTHIQPPGILSPIEVTDERDSMTGIAESASEGYVTRARIESRPTYRVGEILESVPGLIVTQHSGEGKANQYFLRGYNLDHGTDLAIFADGVPVNMRSHAHGQGYADMNFVMPELLSGIDYRKGTYYAAEGDFAGAGAVHLNYLNTLPRGIASLSADTFKGLRAFAADSAAMGPGNLLYGLELGRTNGPWDEPDDNRRVNAMLRYSEGTVDNGFNLTGWLYTADWNSTDQIPKRALTSGALGRWAGIDPSDGGEADRFGLSGGWQRSDGDSATKINAYVMRYDLRLFSNFTYFLDDPVNGDQFRQSERRLMAGFNASHSLFGNWFGREVKNNFGLQVRNDQATVGLFHTRQRAVIGTTRLDDIDQTSAGLYYQNVFHWTEWLRSIAGLRGDVMTGEVNSDTPANSGKADDQLLSPKFGLVLGPWNQTEIYGSWGRGFHSNDIRGSTITVSPVDGTPQSQVPLLVKVTGSEAGMRTSLFPGHKGSLSLFQLEQDSELVFVGDAGNTEASRSSRRRGIEITNRFAATDWLSFDFDLAYTRARFTEADPAGNYIPGAVEGVGSLGFTVDNLGPWFGGMVARYFGPRPLIEDNSIRSSSTMLVEGRVGYKLTPNARIVLEGFNLLNRKDSQIDYYYTSRLAGEPVAGVDDVHFHPVEPLSFRLSLVANF